MRRQFRGQRAPAFRLAAGLEDLGEILSRQEVDRDLFAFVPIAGNLQDRGA